MNSNSSSMATTYLVYGAILAIAVIQIVVAMIMGPSLGRMLILAAIQAYLAVMFFMHLKDEPASLRLFAIIPVMMLSALLIAMLATLG